MLSVHDNEVYAQVADYAGCRIVLHTVYPPADPPEFTDIEFSGVVASHVELQAFRGVGVSANILFDVTEANPTELLGRYAALLAATKNYAWPVLDYDGPGDLAARLTAGGVKCFEVHSSCGLSGFVFAASMEFRRRSSRACSADADPCAAPDPARKAGPGR